MKIIGVVVLLGWAAVTGPMKAASGDPEFIPPSWASPVDPAETVNLTPPFASALGISGQATIRCQAPADGPPVDCIIVSETPEGFGFGEAALRGISVREIRAARLDGEISSRSVQTRMLFSAPKDDEESARWTGPEPTAAALAMAGLMADRFIDHMPNRRDEIVGGLSDDRRELVRGWIEELMPRDRAQERATLSLQLARVFSENDLRRILAGEYVPLPDRETLMKACPELTPEQKAAVTELKRRYCERYECGPAV